MCMAALVDSLQRMGFAAEAHTLRSVGNPAAGVADDAAHMLAVMRPLLDAGKDVVLVAHSYAGFPATSAISGLDKRSRRAKNGSQTAGGGVLGIIFLAAFVPVQGDSIYGLIGETWLPWQTPQVRVSLIEASCAGRADQTWSRTAQSSPRADEGGSGRETGAQRLDHCVGPALRLLRRLQ